MYILFYIYICVFFLLNILCITYTIYIIGEKVCMYTEGNILGVSGFRCFIHLQWASLLFAIPLCSYFPCFRIQHSHEKTQPKNTKHIARSIGFCHLHLFFFVCVFFFLGWFLSCLFVSFVFWFVVWCWLFFFGLAKQHNGGTHDLTLCDFSSLRGCKGKA